MVLDQEDLDGQFQSSWVVGSGVLVRIRSRLQYVLDTLVKRVLWYSRCCQCGRYTPRSYWSTSSSCFGVRTEYLVNQTVYTPSV